MGRKGHTVVAIDDKEITSFMIEMGRYWKMWED